MAKTPRKDSSKSAKPSRAGVKRAAKKTSSSAREPEVLQPEIVDLEPREKNEDFESQMKEQMRAELESVETPEIDPDSGEIEIGAAVVPEIVETAGDTSSKALATADPVSIYLSEIRKYPLLTKEQERELALRYRETGDARAAEMLVTSNLRFVVKVAAEYSRFGAKLIDLIQEGNVGLMHAVKEFNPYKGVRLITYAVWWIRGYIQEYLMRQYSLVRIGTTQNQRKLFYRLQKERDALGSLGQDSSYALLAGRLGVTEEEVETMSKRLSGRDVSLSQPIDGDKSAATLLDFEPSDETAADEMIGHMEEMEVLRQNIEKIRPQLNEKETYILENRVLSDEPMTLQEIGEHYKVTREAVRQIEARLIGKIRAAVTSSLGEDLDSSEDSES